MAFTKLLVNLIRPQFEKRHSFLRKAACNGDTANRIFPLFEKMEQRELAWQKSLSLKARRLKNEYVKKFGEQAIRRLRNDSFDFYDESFEKGMVCSLAIRMIKKRKSIKD